MADAGVNNGKSGAAKAGGGLGPVGAIFLTIFIDLVGFSIIFPLMPAMLQWYLPREGASSLIGRAEAWLTSVSPAAGSGSHGVLAIVLFGGAIGSIFSLLQFVSSPIWGRLSDRFGRRNILLITTSCTCLGYVIWFFSGSFWAYVLSRVMCGLMAGNISVATAAMADATNTSNRTRGMAIVGVSFALGFMIGPAIGGIASMLDLTTYWPGGVRFGLNPFSGAALVSVALALINFCWVFFRFPETLKPENRTRHTISANPFTNLHLGAGSVRRVILVDFSFIVIFSGMEFTVTFLALERLGFGPEKNIAIFVFSGIVMTLVQALFTQRRGALARFGERRFVCLGIIFGLGGMLTLALSYSIPVFFAGLLLKACGISLEAPTLTSLVSLYSPPTRQGAVMGTFRAMGSLARAIGPVIAAALYWAVGSRITYAVASLFLVIPFYLAWHLPDPDRGDTKGKVPATSL
jgi:MFS family permease